nr:hypothetical protein [uncultured Lichenicoccus sp.]
MVPLPPPGLEVAAPHDGVGAAMPEPGPAAMPTPGIGLPTGRTLPATKAAPADARRRKARTTIRLADPLATTIGTRIDANALIFDSEWYRAVHPDVAASRIDPVRHYFDNGAREGRNPNPYFDTNWYATKYPDVAAAGLNPFLHFLLYGAHEGRLPAPAVPAQAEPTA